MTIVTMKEDPETRGFRPGLAAAATIPPNKFFLVDCVYMV